MVSFLLTYLTSLIAAQLTHEVILRKKMGPVRASSFLTLIFISVTYFLPYEEVPALHAVFLGSSFIGMSDPQKISRRQIILASLLFTGIFHFLFGHLKGPGGALGLSAFVSCLITYAAQGALKKNVKQT